MKEYKKLLGLVTVLLLLCTVTPVVILAEDEKYQIDNYAAYDIKIYNNVDEEVQPKGKVYVTIDNPDFNQISDIGVGYVNDMMDNAEIMVKGNNIFKTDHYALYSFRETMYKDCIVTFHVTDVPDAMTDVSRDMEIAYGNKLNSLVPVTPILPEGYTFVGWSISLTES